MIEINATIIAQIINFLILVILLRALAYKPIMKLLQERSDRIAASIDKADADAKAAEDTLKKYQQQLQDAQSKAQEIVDKAEARARDEHAASVQETKREIEQMKKNAQDEIAREREQAVSQLKGEVVALSLAAAEKIIEKNLDSKSNDAIISEFISRLDKKNLGDLSC